MTKAQFLCYAKNSYLMSRWVNIIECSNFVPFSGVGTEKPIDNNCRLLVSGDPLVNLVFMGWSPDQ